MIRGTNADHRQKRSGRATLTLGVALIALFELAVLADVAFRNGAVVPYQGLPAPEGAIEHIARWIAGNMTPLCWTAFLLLLDGLLIRVAGRDRAPGAANSAAIRSRPLRFAICFLTSIPIWLVFDGINFGFINAWDYHGLPDNVLHRRIAYFFAFGAICPAMFLTAELLIGLRLFRLQGPVVRIGPRLRVAMMIAGLLAGLFPILVREPIGSLTLWLAFWFLLDPINHRLGAPSLIGDWAQGRWTRTLALMLAGLICGFLWEFWNYWATAKWTYDLPFLGAAESVRYFEMPVIGLLGFLPFALECWVMFQSVVLILRRIGLRRIEALPDDAIL